MERLVLTTQYDTNSTLISNIFIDRYMSAANGEFVKIYLYLLRSLSDANLTVSIASMADIFNQTEADVIRALKYWHKQGVVQLTVQNSSIAGITICNLASSNDTTANSDFAEITPAINNTEAPAPNTTPEPEVSATKEEPVKPARETSHYYSPAQIQKISSNDIEFQMLLRGITNYLGGSMSTTELSAITYFYDTLHFPTDLIEYLVEYCVTKGHKSIRYIEKVALAWADAGITTVQQAKLESSSHNETAYAIMRAFGQNNRDFGQAEQDYIAKWTNTYGFTTELILEACNRTLKTTHQPSFQYADSILSKWNSSNIRSLSDVEKADAEFAKKRPSYNKKTAATNNRFNNFNQRDTDIDSLESSLLSNNQK